MTLLALLLVACPGPAPKDTSGDPTGIPDTDDTGTAPPADTGPFDSDGDGVVDGADCAPDDPAISPAADEICNGLDDDCDGETDEDALQQSYADVDGDGFGDPGVGFYGCGVPEGNVADGTDCDDADAAVFPGAPEPDCTDPVDYDCDGETAYADADGDGVAACEDCDDADADAHPGANEPCDGDDDDCDGVADDGATTTWYGDADADGFGGTRFTLDACDAPLGYVADATDCDDLDAAAFPGADETCDGDDDDCDGAADEDAVDAPTFFADVDGDGFGDAASAVAACDAPAGFVADDTDCDDADLSVFPGAVESCDGVDHDCDGAVDEDDSADASAWYADVDHDGYAGEVLTRTACSAPSGYSASAEDCDDADADVHPGATETCDGTDEDCDGSTDEAGASGARTWYRDADGDGYGDAATSVASCTAPSGYGSVGTDCDDTRASVSPVGTEICDDLDDDCDGSVDESGATGGNAYYPDADGDGFGEEGGTTVTACDAPVGYRLDGTDCDDHDITTHPYAWEDTSNGVDDDCDGATDGADTDVRHTGPSGNDAGSTVNLSTTSFPFCGSTYTTVYMQTNGRVTFGSSDTDSTETTVDLASDVTVAGVWDDLRSSSSSTMDWIQYDDAAGFYWRDVPENGDSTTSTFSIVLFDDGRILLQYEGLSMNDGLAGFSCGAGGSAGTETDLTAAMDALGAGRWGLGNADEDTLYEVFTSDNDLDNSVVRLCGNVDDGTTDPCAE